jgi:hypothetical protein
MLPPLKNSNFKFELRHSTYKFYEIVKSPKSAVVIATEAKQSDSSESRPETAKGVSKDLLAQDPSLCLGQRIALDCHGASRLAMTAWDFLRTHQF